MSILFFESLAESIRKEDIEKILFENLVLNVYDGLSYDNALRAYTVDKRLVINMSVSNIPILIKIINSEIDPSSQHKYKNELILVELLKKITYKNTTLNFECCQYYGLTCEHFGADTHSIHPLLKTTSTTKVAPLEVIPLLQSQSQNKKVEYYFKSKAESAFAIMLIGHMIKEGAQVICADFSAKSLICNWDTKVFGAECPFEICGTYPNSNINVKYNIDETKKCCFPQLASLAFLSKPSSLNSTMASTSMNTMADTIKYKVKSSVSQNLIVKVMSVIDTDTTTLSSPLPTGNFEDIKALPLKRCNAMCGEQLEEYLKDKSGSVTTKMSITDSHELDTKTEPVHTIVIFKNMPGSLVVSSFHISNLTNIDTTLEKVVNTAATVLGRERSVSINNHLRSVSIEEPALLRSVTATYAREISASSTSQTLCAQELANADKEQYQDYDSNTQKQKKLKVMESS